MQTDRVGCGPADKTCTPANNFSAVRVSKDLRNRSSVGVIVVNRTGTGVGSERGNWNRSWGADGKWGIGDALTFSGFAARTETPGATRPEHAFSSGVEYNTRPRRAFFEYTEVGDDFNPEVGFIERPDGFRQLWTGWYENIRSPRLTRAGLREYRPDLTYESFWGFDGLQETATLHFDHAIDWESGYLISRRSTCSTKGCVNRSRCTREWWCQPADTSARLRPG